jgi:hypothetical protein
MGRKNAVVLSIHSAKAPQKEGKMRWSQLSRNERIVAGGFGLIFVVTLIALMAMAWPSKRMDNDPHQPLNVVHHSTPVSNKMANITEIKHALAPRHLHRVKSAHRTHHMRAHGAAIRHTSNR